ACALMLVHLCLFFIPLLLRGGIPYLRAGDERRTHRPPRRKNGIVQNIDQIYSGDGKVGYLLYADGKKFLLDMERDESVLSHHFNSKYVDVIQGDPAHRECYYRGTVDSHPESLALFNLCGGLDGFFALRHARYTVKPLIRAKGAENEVYGSDQDSHRGLHYYTRESFRFEAAVPALDTCGTRTRKGGWGWHHQEQVLARQRLSVSRARHVELLLVADESMSKKYGKDLQHYLLTLASIASRLYGHASIENPIRLAVVKVVVLSDKEKGIEVNKNAATTLKSFCKWQNQQNQLDDDHEEHYDAAILFTRQVSLHHWDWDRGARGGTLIPICLVSLGEGLQGSSGVGCTVSALGCRMCRLISCIWRPS
uniref:Peptidase M12B domain-containing protein n=1 Tax=Erpetoichthys calabaricus TaxID=27687 RepID=A0A8C4T5J9_ERPCA